MKLIDKKNVLPIICIAYTFVSMFLTIFEIIVRKEMNPTQLNIFLFLILSMLGIGVLSQHYRFERYSPLAMVLIQYLLAVSIIVVSLWIASFFVDIHPNGYKDMTVSFSVPYGIGAIIYFICLKVEVKKQNALLNTIKKKRNQEEGKEC